MCSIGNSGAVGSAGRGDVLRLLTLQNLTAQFGSDQPFALSDSCELSPSSCLRLSMKPSELNRQTQVNRTHSKSQKTNTRDLLKSPKNAILQHRKLLLCGRIHGPRIADHGSRLPLATSHSSLAAEFLPGSALRVESDVTHSKQATETFLPGSRIADLRFGRISGMSPEMLAGGVMRLSQLFCSNLKPAPSKIPRRARAISTQVYASSAVCYACCMAPQFPSDKRAQAAPESNQVRAPQSYSAASVRAGNADSITSRDNKWLKQFRAALRGTGPAAGEPIPAEGPKLVEEGVRSGLETEALLVSEAGERHLERILQVAGESDSGIPRSRIFRTTDKLFEGVAGTEAPQGVAALFRQREWGFDDVMRGRANLAGAFSSDSPLIVVMAAVQDPGNVGTIVRSAEAFGASGVVATRGTADPWSPKALRASAGSALRLPLIRGMAIPVFLAQLRVAGVSILAAGTKAGAATSARDAAAPMSDLRGPCAIFIGNEGAGLPNEVEHSADDWISIAMNKDVESLNAGVAASVILFEAARQRRGA